MKHIFIMNPAAGNGSAEKKYHPLILQAMKSSGLEYEIHRSLNKQEIGTYIRQRAAVGDAVRFYAIGGDGTLCDVVNGAIGFDNAQVAVIPAGSGNDFVRNFSNKENFSDISRQISGTAFPVDVIKCNDFYSVNMLNIGADCEVVVRASQIKSKSPSTSYIRGALDVLPKNPRYRMVFTDEEGQEHEEDVLLVAVGNGKFCGGGFKGAPKAVLSDGLMDVVVVRPVTGFTMFKLLYKYHQGTHLEAKEAPELIRFMQLREFRLRAIDSVNISVDGEVEPFTEAAISIIPGAIRLVVPEGSSMLQE